MNNEENKSGSIPPIEWEKVTPVEAKIIHQCTARAINHFPQIDRQGLFMDICAVHILVPLDLNRLLTSNDGDFGHDIIGIHNHFDRTTHELQQCFCPRHAIDQ